MDIYLIARQQVERSMADQFRDTPEANAPVRPAPPRPGIVITLRQRLSADLRALAAAIEPRTSLTPNPTASQR